MFPSQLDYQTISNLRNNDDQLSAIVNNYFTSLIPVVYRRESTDPVQVNQFDITFNVNMNYG
jgi:hypothetical protein